VHERSGPDAGQRTDSTTLVQILEQDGFLKRVNDNGITEYGVPVLTQEEIEKNTKNV
jgi:hypothetical protein